MFYTMTNVNENVNFLDDVPEANFNYEANLEGALMNIYESEVNWNSLMEAIAMDELTHFIENGNVMVYEGVKLNNFFTKMKDFFKNLWGKIKGFFDKFFSVINSYILNDKTFVKKYEKALRDKNIKDFEYKGYSFTNLDKSNEMKSVATLISSEVDNAKKATSKTVEQIKQMGIDLTDNETKELDSARGKFIGKSSTEYDDFNKELFMYFRNKEDSPIIISGANVGAELKYISDAKDNIKAARDDMKEYENIINKVVSGLNTLESDLTKGEKDDEKELNSAKSSYILKGISRVKALLSIAQTFSGAKVTALKSRNRQAKSICVKVLSYKHESVNLSSYEEGSLVNQVNFI